MRTLEATGKSIDEAIFNGLRELQISIDEVEIDIIQQETKGVFGIGAKPAIVRLIEREPEQIVIPDYIANKNMPRERRERRDRRDNRKNEDLERYLDVVDPPHKNHPFFPFCCQSSLTGAASAAARPVRAAPFPWLRAAARAFMPSPDGS